MLCASCKASPPGFDAVRAPYLMAGQLRDLVYGLKYRGLTSWAPRMGELMAAHLDSHTVGFDVVLPVPLHRRRERERGYNQSELLARTVGRLAGVTVEPQLLRRRRHTPPQVSMSSIDERRGNMDGAFECADYLDSRRVLLVDDVVTTGATMAACSGALKAGGAESVWGLALARHP